MTSEDRAQEWRGSGRTPSRRTPPTRPGAWRRRPPGRAGSSPTSPPPPPTGDCRPARWWRAGTRGGAGTGPGCAAGTCARSVAVGTDGEFYLLTVPDSVRGRVTGVTLAPAQPRLVVGEGARDGERISLSELLDLRLAAGDDWPIGRP